MTTRELIQAEIAKIPEEKLGELYGVVRAYAASRPAPDRRSIMTKLREIHIEGPADFSENLELYLSGEKRVDEDVH
jgi:hypothetical protein